jgi:hypothetical protein
MKLKPFSPLVESLLEAAFHSLQTEYEESELEYVQRWNLLGAQFTQMLSAKTLKSEWEPSALQSRINSWYNRRDTTPWSPKELKALKSIPEPEEEELTLLAEYTMNSPYRRRDILTLLNNWQGELDRARRWESEAVVPTGDSNPLYPSMLR